MQISDFFNLILVELDSHDWHYSTLSYIFSSSIDIILQCSNVAGPQFPPPLLLPHPLLVHTGPLIPLTNSPRYANHQSVLSDLIYRDSFFSCVDNRDGTNFFLQLGRRLRESCRSLKPRPVRTRKEKKKRERENIPEICPRHHRQCQCQKN